jgi:hypothetical protein
MDADGDQENKILKTKGTKTSYIKRYDVNVSTILQSIWVRCRSVFPVCTDGKFMESELRLVLYCGAIFWALYLVYEAFK